MTPPLSGRTVLVTGATGVAGTTAAVTAAGEGARLVLTGRDAGRLAQLAERVGDAVAACEVADLVAPGAAESLASAHPEVDVVWHLVGGWRGGTPFAEQPLDDWHWLHEQLVVSTVHLARAFAPSLSAAEHGRFAIVSSPQAVAPTSGNAAYASAKAAAEAAVLALADSFRSGRATANVVVVPAIGAKPASAVTPEDVAAALVYLSSAAAARMNGQRIRLLAGGRP
jgi:NADP-dependent 3-hydroxy acid dehydrogenase YdfG